MLKEEVPPSITSNLHFSWNHQDLDRVFASQYVQSGTFGAEAQGIENSVKGVGWVSKRLIAE